MTKNKTNSKTVTVATPIRHKNHDLNHAKRSKNDEFYTQMSDVEKEMVHYQDFFNGKVIYCNCDTENSHIFQYFALHFDEFNLKALIATHVESKTQIKITKQPNIQDDKIILTESDKIIMKEFGDFRSAECLEILKESDVVVSNPPFSLFREYIPLLFNVQKFFIVLGNMNAVTYREIFPFIQSNQLFYGPSISSGDREFQVPDDYPLYASGMRVDNNGNKFVRVKGVRWFTNINHEKQKEKLVLTESYSKAYYPHYDNYDAIEVSKTKLIPKNYNGIMGVPITFLDKYNAKQFKIVGFINDGKIKGKTFYKRFLIQRR